MDAAEFEQLLVGLREGRVHVRVGLEGSHGSSDPAVASSLAGQRAERIARGDRVAYVYKSPEDSDDDYSIRAAIDAEQARMLLAAHAVELGAEKSSPAPAPPLTSWEPGFPDTASRASAPVITDGMTAPPASPAQADELPRPTDARAPADQRVGDEAAHLEGSTSTSAGTVQASWAERKLLASPASDAPEGKDLLQLDREVDALSSLLVAKNVEPPLSVGLFGEWGSGKSFFMKELHRAIEVKAASEAEDTFCRKVIQIRFNAWHYVDADLWSSLAAGVFDALSREFKQEFTQACIAELDALKDRKRELTSQQDAIAERAKTVDGEIDRQREQDKQRTLALSDYVKGLHDHMVRDIAANPTVIAVTKQLRTQGQLDRVELETLRGDVETALGRARRWWATLRSPARLAMVGFLVAWPAILTGLVLYASTAWTTGGAVLGVVSILGVIRTWVASVVPGVKQVDRALAAVDEIERHAREQRTAGELALAAERQAIAARIAELEHEQLHLSKREAELQTQLAALSDERSLKDFVVARAAADDYRKRLGVMSAVRQDFQQLAKFLAPGHEGPDVDRIILYIDDLDRCGVDHIIAVLQAVHLLLAFRLFVVVVGVDPRRLIDSLEQHYRPLTGSKDSADRKTTPRGYLEKIFQIPFVLRPMGAKGFQNLVSELVRPVPSPTPQPAVQGNEAPAATLAPATASPRKSAISLIEISDAERAFMQKLGALIPTPRAAKRFVNMYRLMRAISTDDIVAHDSWRLPMVLLALLIGEPDDAAELYKQIAQASDASWLEFAKAHPGGAATKLSSILNNEALMNTPLADLQTWIPTVSRYSFV